MSHNNCLILLNPRAAGGRAARLVPALQAWVRARPYSALPRCKLICSQSIAHARQVIGELPERSRVVIVGGDGSVHQTLPPILAGSHSLGLVPFGSGNDTARAYGLLGMQPIEALTYAVQTDTHQVDVGLVQLGADVAATPFVSSLAAGFDAAIALRAHSSPKWLIGLPRYLYATALEIHALKRNEVQLTISGGDDCDKSIIPYAPVLFSSVLNTATFGSGMPAVPHARVDDGRLDLLVAGEFGRAGALAMLPRLLMGKHLSHARVMTRSFSGLLIESRLPLPLAADGEPLPSAAHIVVQVLAQKLAVVTRDMPKK